MNLNSCREFCFKNLKNRRKNAKEMHVRGYDRKVVGSGGRRYLKMKAFAGIVYLCKLMDRFGITPEDRRMGRESVQLLKDTLKI